MYYITIVVIVILTGCSNSISYLQWRAGEKNKFDKEIDKSKQNVKKLTRRREELKEQYNEIEEEVERKREYIRQLQEKIKINYANIQRGYEVEKNINEIQNRLNEIIKTAEEVAGYVNKAKLLTKIAKAKKLSRKIDIIKKATKKHIIKAFLREIPLLDIIVVIWDIYDALNITDKTPNAKGYKYKIR